MSALVYQQINVFLTLERSLQAFYMMSCIKNNYSASAIILLACSALCTSCLDVLNPDFLIFLVHSYPVSIVSLYVSSLLFLCYFYLTMLLWGVIICSNPSCLYFSSASFNLFFCCLCIQLNPDCSVLVILLLF